MGDGGGATDHVIFINECKNKQPERFRNDELAKAWLKEVLKWWIKKYLLVNVEIGAVSGAESDLIQFTWLYFFSLQSNPLNNSRRLIKDATS